MRITNDEKEAWHKDVNVYFQDKAWADTEISVHWVNKTLRSAIERNTRFVLFCDNLSAQVILSAIGGLVCYGVPNATDLLQPVDASFGELLKVLTKQEHNRWLDCDENADRWYGNTEPFSAKEQRILITHWVGNAYNKLIFQDYKTYAWRMWEEQDVSFPLMVLKMKRCNQKA